MNARHLKCRYSITLCYIQVAAVRVAQLQREREVRHAQREREIVCQDVPMHGWDVGMHVESSYC